MANELRDKGIGIANDAVVAEATPLHEAQGRWTPEEANLCWDAFVQALAANCPELSEPVHSFFQPKPQDRTHKGHRKIWADAKRLCHQALIQYNKSPRSLNSIKSKMLSEYDKRYSKKNNEWSKTQIDTVLEMRNKGFDFVHIAAEVGRSRDACKHIYQHHSRTKGLGRFSAQENMRLIQLVEETISKRGLKVDATYSGLPWSEIAQSMPGRTPACIRNAWVRRLAPERLPAKSMGITEDLELLRAIKKTGAKSESELNWSKLHAQIDGQKAKLRLARLSKALDHELRGAPLEKRVRTLLKMLETLKE